MSASSDTDTTKKTILLEDFQNPINEWKSLNDPVMGGQSYSQVEIEDGVAKFSGKCAIVPKLQAPGFITMETGNQLFDMPSKFPDISSCEAFRLQIKTNTPYAGYRFSFGKAHAKGGRFAFGYKTPLLLDEDLPPVGEFGDVILPFGRFSDRWDDATGDIITECEDDPSFCPTSRWLQSIETISFWGEGVEGMVDLEVKSIHAVGCSLDASEIAVAPSWLMSKTHTIASNPVYTIGAVVLGVLVCIVLGCCSGCGACLVRRRRRYKTMPPPVDSHLEGVYKDDIDDSDDIELS